MHIPSLDGWRALAITIVFLAHAGLGWLIPGGLGVTIFFFLSGYLITTLLIEEHKINGNISVRNFYIRRFLRLTPPLLTTLIIVYFLTTLGTLKGGVSSSGFLSQLFYFSNYYSLYFDSGNTTPAGTGVFWSLAVEEHFYLAFPFAFSLFHKNKKYLAFSLGAVCIGALLWRYILVTQLRVGHDVTYYSTDTRIDSIVYGCILAILKNPANQHNKRTNLNSIDYALISITILLLIFTLTYRDAVFRETLRYSLQGIALAPLFYYSISFSNEKIFAPLNTQWVKKIGQLSYSIYLIHYVLLSNYLDTEGSNISQVILVTGMTLVYATLLDRYVESPARKLRLLFKADTAPQKNREPTEDRPIVIHQTDSEKRS